MNQISNLCDSSFLAFVICVTLLGPTHAEVPAEVKPILDKAIQAAGGASRLARLEAVSFRSKWKVVGSAAGNAYADQSTLKGFDKYRGEMDVQENGKFFNAVQVINGDKVWFKFRNKTIERVKDPSITARKEVFYVARLPELILPLRDKIYKLAPLGEIDVSGRPAVGILASCKGHVDVGMFFDKETGLLAKSHARVNAENGQEHVFDCLFENYKDFDGLKHFTQVKIDVDGKRYFEIELTDIKPVANLEDDFFSKP